MYAHATVLFHSTSHDSIIDLFEANNEGRSTVLFRGNIGTEFFSDPKEFLKKLAEKKFVFDGIKCWYQRERLKIDDELVKKISYADGIFDIKSGEYSETLPIGHYMSNFSNIPDQLDIPLPTAINVMDDLAVKIIANNGEYGKLMFFFGDKASWENKTGLPKQEVTVINASDFKKEDEQK